MDGWISLHRKILNNPIVCKDADHVAIWIYLLLNATHAETKMIFGGQPITLKPGQLITGRKSISLKFNISESKVQRVLKSLENEQQIEQQTNNKHRLITIVKWDLYQDKNNKNKKSEQQDEQQLNNERTTTEQQLNTNNNVYNTNNKNKKHISPEIEDFFESVWKLYPLKQGKGSISNKQKKILYDLGYDTIKKCIERYTATNPKEGFVKHGSTFFNSGYIDFLDDNSESNSCETLQKVVASKYAEQEVKTKGYIDRSIKVYDGGWQ